MADERRVSQYGILFEVKSTSKRLTSSYVIIESSPQSKIRHSSEYLQYEVIQPVLPNRTSAHYVMVEFRERAVTDEDLYGPRIAFST